MEINVKIVVYLENECTLKKMSVHKGIENTGNTLRSLKRFFKAVFTWHGSQIKNTDIQ